METIARSGSHYFQWKPFFSVEAICFIRSYSFQQKMVFLVETIPFSASHYFQWKPLACSSIHSIWWKLLPLIESISFNGSYCFYWKAFVFMEIIAPLFLVEGAPFNQNFSFQSKPFFLVLQHFRQENLPPVTRIIRYK